MDILEFIKNNAASILTLLGVILSQVFGYHLGKIKDDAERSKTTTDAEKEMREDLQVQLDKSQERNEKKDIQIYQLNKENDEWRRKALELELEVTRKAYHIEVLQKRLDDYERKVFYVPTPPADKAGGD